VGFFLNKEGKKMKKTLIPFLATLLVSSSIAYADVSVYGSLNYMLSNDDNASGEAVMKAQNNGSKIGIDFSESLPTVEGSTQSITGFAKLEVGIDADDSGSDTFDSRLAYVGVDLGELGAVSGGRQSNPTDGVSKTNIFNVYGNNAVFTYASRSSNSLKYENSVGPVSISALGVIDGASGKDGLDVTDISASTELGPLSVAAGLVDDRVNSVKYTVLSAGAELAGLDLGATYSMKDAATDLTGLEYTASKSFGDTTLAVGFGDKEGTAQYMTYGVSRSISDSLLTYAEYQTTDNDTGVDTTQMSAGLKFSF
jgi:predicted porin